MVTFINPVDIFSEDESVIYFSEYLPSQKYELPAIFNLTISDRRLKRAFGIDTCMLTIAKHVKI